MPSSITSYVHRIGRTGRVGNCGKSISFVDSQYDHQLFSHLKQSLIDSSQDIPDWLEEFCAAGGALSNFHKDDNLQKDIRNYSHNSEKLDINEALKVFLNKFFNRSNYKATI